MSKKITLNKVPLADCAAIAHELFAGKVKAHAVIYPIEGWEFHYTEGSQEPAKQGRYRVVDPVRLSWSLMYPRKKHGELQISPGMLIDDQGKFFRLFYDEIHFNDDGIMEHYIDERGNHIPVDLPAQFIELEWLEALDKPSLPRGPAGLLVQEYLEAQPSGNLANLKRWAAEKYGAEEAKGDISKQLVWVDHMGEAQKTSEKTLSNLLSKYRKS